MNLYQKLLNQPVSDLKLRELITVSPQTTVRQAISKMKQKSIGCVVVVDEHGRPQGKFTERLLISLLLKTPNGLDEPVGDHMASTWAFVKKTDPIAQVIDHMDRLKLRFVCVVDDEDRAIALTGQKSVVEFLADQFPREVKVQLLSSKMYMDQREGA